MSSAWISAATRALAQLRAAEAFYGGELIEAGEGAGILEDLLDRLATYMEKTEAIKSKIRSALMYPISVIIVAFVVVTIIMIFVIPAFKEVFTSFGADLLLRLERRLQAGVVESDDRTRCVPSVRPSPSLSCLTRGRHAETFTSESVRARDAQGVPGR